MRRSLRHQRTCQLNTHATNKYAAYRALRPIIARNKKAHVLFTESLLQRESKQ